MAALGSAAYAIAGANQSMEPQDRWAWVEIDLAALRQNTRAFQDVLAHGTQMMAVVKADGYGHGAVACAMTLQRAGVQQLAVATVDEGIELRDAGISLPILILNEPPITSVDQLVAYNLMPSVYTMEFGLAFGEASAAAGTIGSYHLAIETGMTRIGVRPEDAVELRHALDFHRGLRCAGTFTHFATADILRDWDYELQLNRFRETIAALKGAGLETGLVHCDNTPGTVLHPDSQFDMCRVGIGLYGLHPSTTTRSAIKLKPVMSVRGKITRVEYPPVGSGVGYGATYRVPKQNIQIATVPIGYADGLARTLSNRMEVLVNGYRCRQVGNICMDQFMFAVDVNTTRAYKPQPPVIYGDVVTVLGADGRDEITADEMAELRGTINYEVVCNFGQRLERVYV